MTRTAVVMSGGGAGGAVQVGFLEALEERGISAGDYVGISVGALNTTGMVYGGFEALKRTWMDIRRNRDILRLNWARVFTDGLYSTKPLRKKVRSFLRDEAPVPDRTGYVGYVDFRTMDLVYRSLTDPLASEDFIVASSSIPVAMRPVRTWLFDGGVREMTPLEFAVTRLAADRIFVLLCDPFPFRAPLWSKRGVFAIGIRAIDTLQHEVQVNDVKVTRLKNGIPGYREVELHVMAPDPRLIGTLDFDPKKIREAHAQGLRVGREVLKEVDP